MQDIHFDGGDIDSFPYTHVRFCKALQGPYIPTAAYFRSRAREKKRKSEKAPS